MSFILIDYMIRKAFEQSAKELRLSNRERKAILLEILCVLMEGDKKKEDIQRGEGKTVLLEFNQHGLLTPKCEEAADTITASSSFSGLRTDQAEEERVFMRIKIKITE